MRYYADASEDKNEEVATADTTQSSEQSLITQVSQEDAEKEKLS